MVNTHDFTKRIERILAYYSLTASQFADKIEVQRSSISHLMSGRNKPSLDFVLKVVKVFPEVNLYWLLNGKGSFPNIEKPIQNSTTQSTTTVEETETSSATKSTKKEIEKIIIFYSDGSFDHYQPKDV